MTLGNNNYKIYIKLLNFERGNFMEFSVDRIEENIAILEDKDKTKLELELEALPKGIKEGDILDFKNGEYRIDTKKTQAQKNKNYDLFMKLAEK